MFLIVESYWKHICKSYTSKFHTAHRLRAKRWDKQNGTRKVKSESGRALRYNKFRIKLKIIINAGALSFYKRTVDSDCSNNY